MDEYVPMQTVLVPKEIGTVKIEHYGISEKEAEFAQLRSAIHARPEEYVESGKYVRLYINGRLAMSDTDMEKRSNLDFVRNANGKMLVAGLGIGLIIIPALRKKEVESIEIIEKNEDVIHAVGMQLRSYLMDQKLNRKLSIIKDDVFKYKPEKGKKWDVIYFDIWNDICVDNLEGITKLKRKFARRLNRANPRCWMGAWQEDNLRYNKRTRGW
jgi:predicted membrane-bound spermidine synthase